MPESKTRAQLAYQSLQKYREKLANSDISADYREELASALEEKYEQLCQ